MISYEVACYHCKRKFSVLPGSNQYNQFKKNRKSIFCCDDCSHQIRFEAIRNFFRDKGKRI